MAATAATVSVGTSDTVLFDATQDGGPCSGLSISNRDSGTDLSVKVTPIHDNYIIIPAGSERTFGRTGGGSQITRAVGKVASGTINVNSGVVARG